MNIVQHTLNQSEAGILYLEEGGDNPGQVCKDVGEEETNMDLMPHTAHLP